MRPLVLSLAVFFGHTLPIQLVNAQEMPKVVLIGDSIRLSYTATVKEQLAGRATVISPKANGGDSANVLKHLDSWVINQDPDVVHFNCGIHDTKKFKATESFQVSPEQYEANLRAIVGRIREKTNAKILFATTTPILDARAAEVRSDRDYELLAASVASYNEIAEKVMGDLSVPVNDLHSVIAEGSQPVEELIRNDGVHLTETGQAIAGKTVAEFILSNLPKSEQAANPWSLADWKKTPAFEWVDQEHPIHSLTFENEPYDGQTSDVFAFYATPQTIAGQPPSEEKLPAVVLIHGGGGTAFAEWTWLWAKRGYAAIAMDLSGRRPEAPSFDSSTGELIVKHGVSRSRLKRGGPEANHVSKFDNVGGDLTDDWQRHAVAAVMRAHSLVRSFPEVDAERTAVTGISWGGYLTCLAASLDDRFKAAVPVYGCGFLADGESVQRPMIERLDESKRREWNRIYDPSAWLPQCRVPVLFVNGTNDKHYPLVSYSRSFALVPGDKQIRIEPGMRHSHIHGWTPKEIGLFIDQHVNDGIALPKLETAVVESGRIRAEVTSTLSLKTARLAWTEDSGRLVDRKWQQSDAVIAADSKSISADVPREATVWLLTVTDSRDAMVSSPPVFAESTDGESN